VDVEREPKQTPPDPVEVLGRGRFVVVDHDARDGIVRSAGLDAKPSEVFEARD
jgi:hypothetical protein